MEDLDTCMMSGLKIEYEVYKPVWRNNNRGTCVFSGDNK